jgi:hypothetical protein
MKKRHLLHCKIAGFTYWDGPAAFPELKIGTVLRLVREDANKFDPYAVAIYYGEYKLGFVPKEHNHELSKFVELGHDIFETRIQRISPDQQPEEQIQVVIYILPAGTSGKYEV